MSSKRKSRGLRGQFSRRPLPLWIVIIADVLVFGIALNVFALFHHALPRREESLNIVSDRFQFVQAPEAEIAAPAMAPAPTPAGDAPTPEPSATPAGAAPTPKLSETPEPTEAPEKDWVGHFGQKFATRFTDGEIIKDRHSYRSDTLSVTLAQRRYNKSNIYVADIYVKDIQQFKTAFANDTFGTGQYEWPRHICKRVDAVIAVNGDNYAARQDGVVIRNGELFKNRNASMDVCVIYWDGRMETFRGRSFKAKDAIAAGAYQAWNFGPTLLDKNGAPLKHFTNTTVGDTNPRTVLGYFEPGHYCLVVVDGRSEDSVGLGFRSLAKLMSALGCKQAFNLDGGNTSMMMVGDTVISEPSEGGRASSDIIYFVP